MLTIISYNIRGITSSIKHLLFKTWLNQNQHDVVLLQELHMTKIEHFQTFKNAFPEYNITCSLGTWKSGGALVMVKKKYEVVDTGTDSTGRIAFIKIICNNIPIVIVSVYAPAQITDRCAFFKELRLHIPSAEWVVIGGDFNCAPDGNRDRYYHSIHTDYRSYPLLLHEVIHPLLLIEIFRYKHPHQNIFSYHSDDGKSHNRIDLFFGSKAVQNNTDRIYYSPVGLSDHDSIIIQLNIPFKCDKQFHRWICNPKMVSRKLFMENFQAMWNVFIDTVDFNTTEWWLDFKTSLILLLQDEQKQFNIEKRSELRKLQNEYRSRASDPKENDLVDLELIRKDIRRLLEEKSDNNLPGHQEFSMKHLSNLAKSRFVYNKSNQNKISYLIHPTKGRVETDTEMLDVATSFYQDLYNIKPVDKSVWNDIFNSIPKLNQANADDLEHDITQAECFEALQAMPLGRAPGLDGITVEVWTKLFPIIGEHFVRMVNNAKIKGHFDDGFLNALLTLLKKEGNYNGTMKNFRPLSLMNIDYKIISKVLSTRLKKILNQIIHHDQSCGLPSRSIQDNVHLIRSIIDYHSRNRVPIGILQWDQEKAFDRINHDYLFEALRQFGFGFNFINYIKLLYTNSTFTIKVNNCLSDRILFQSGVRQGCSLSGGLYVICLEPLLHSIRRNPRIPGILPPGGEYRDVARSVYNNDNVNVKIKLSAYADDVCTMAFNLNDERETIAMFYNYNKASGGKTNDNKTVIFWISDCLDPPLFDAKIEREHCTFLGVPMNTKGEMPLIELKKIISSIKQLMGLWSTIKLSLFERATVLKCFILSRLVYCMSLMPVQKKIIDSLQKDINGFFWNKKHPAIKFNTCVGRKCDGGFALVHLKSMIASYRIKCGLKIISSLPKVWKFYAYQHVGIQLRTYAPWIWTNLVPHFIDNNHFFGEVAYHTLKWIVKNGGLSTDGNEKSVYWTLIDMNIFRPPVCVQRVGHLKEILFFKIIHKSNLPTTITEFWCLLSNYGINTRDRLGRTASEKKCLYCNYPETISHLFIHCQFFNKLFKMLVDYVQNISSLLIERNDNDIIYLKIISSMVTNKVKRQTAYVIGNYLYAIWLYRAITINDGVNASRNGYIHIFKASMKYLPYDNG